MEEQVKGGKGYYVDVKRSVPSEVKEIYDNVVGFANTPGSYVLIGVDNENKIIGTGIDDSKRFDSTNLQKRQENTKSCKTTY